jgi:hypothetical protein
VKRVLVLAEGQTEERFIKTLLQPHLWTRDIHIEPKIVVTKTTRSGPNFKGGLTNYGQVKRDLTQLLADSGAALVTTFFDLYGVPSDIPGYHHAKELIGVARAGALEAALTMALGTPRKFRPFLMVHEYEAVLYCNPLETARVLTRPGQQSLLTAERGRVASPEDINDGPDTHPSRRISRLFPNYDKALHGPLIASGIGIDTIRQQCPHFADWLQALESA